MNQQVTDRIFIELSAIIVFVICISMIIKTIYEIKTTNKKTKIKKEELKTLDNDLDIVVCMNELSKLRIDRIFNNIFLWIYIIGLISSIVAIGVFAGNGSANGFPDTPYRYA